MTRGAMSCNWIFMMALATGIPGSRRRCFATCSVLLPRAPSLIDTFEAASLMPNYRLRTKRHWAKARPTSSAEFLASGVQRLEVILQSELQHARVAGTGDLAEIRCPYR